MTNEQTSNDLSDLASSQQANRMQTAIQNIKAALSEEGKSRDQKPLIDQEVKDKESDRKLKRLYAIWFVAILIGQLLIMNGIMVFHGLGILVFTEWALNIYVSATIAEVFGVVLVITKNLFPNKK